MWEFALRVAGMYFLALILVRLIGKRALGELGPFDFVVMTGVGDTVISVALNKTMPFSDGIIVLATLALLEYSMGYLGIKNGKISNLITGVPVILIDNGKVIKENLAREKFNVDDLRQELRKKGVRDIQDVEKGILESCGGFSVILKEEKEPVSRKDLGISSKKQKSLLTTDQLSRADFFAQQEEQLPSEDSIFCLENGLKSIEEKLDCIYQRLEYLESK